MVEPIDALKDDAGTPDFRQWARDHMAGMPVHWGDALPRDEVDRLEALLLNVDFLAVQREKRNERRRLYGADVVMVLSDPDQYPAGTPYPGEATLLTPPAGG